MDWEVGALSSILHLPHERLSDHNPGGLRRPNGLGEEIVARDRILLRVATRRYSAFVNGLSAAHMVAQGLHITVSVHRILTAALHPKYDIVITEALE